VSLGPAEILVIFVVALLVFGPTRLPEIGRQVGKGIRELRKFQHSMRSDFEDAFADDEIVDDASEHAEPAPTLPPKQEAIEGPDPSGAVEEPKAPPEPS
jgi:TatA/E family protein of Tat protein translocase